MLLIEKETPLKVKEFNKFWTRPVTMLVNEVSLCAQQGKAHKALVKHIFTLGKPKNSPTPKPTPVAEPRTTELDRSEVRRKIHSIYSQRTFLGQVQRFLTGSRPIILMSLKAYGMRLQSLEKIKKSKWRSSSSSRGTYYSISIMTT
jgi:hypothetical protein